MSGMLWLCQKCLIVRYAIVVSDVFDCVRYAMVVSVVF